MKISYYPGCTLKTKAKNLDRAAIASLEALGVEVEEIDRWNCCGAVYSLTADDLIHMVGPVRNLIRAKEQGADKLVTLCSMCYNTLARANQLMREDTVKRDTINRFMDDEIDYAGEVEVVHYLSFLEQEIGWEKLKEAVKAPLSDLKVGTYYGCTLQRPADVGIEPFGSYLLMTGMLEALGATVVPFAAADKCCGSYQVLGAEPVENSAAAAVINIAGGAGIEALATSCPLCEYNLGKQQKQLLAKEKIGAPVPTYYFTQLLALALGLEAEVCHFELNDAASLELLKSKNCLAAA
ncbi:CoB--CoM heterodisulfide reductase iron-sulfur subunit B family protein [Desulfopila aestuarii]|uniref:Heterodisulfide reductase subunit B n=1 Tax=Desulfopila aestuarii DSM 18488 TaxID=1121416 RepID=A0A1M7XVQ9_9BACT|nr:heterodisulfide reductase-related iron-sulfur binding cluster [Desulfopila aestuarii]SHO42760.1 heterodisulfide reductase subunit B [Desulfopila aestuarii DSM 18488]